MRHRTRTVNVFAIALTISLISTAAFGEAAGRRGVFADWKLNPDYWSEENAPLIVPAEAEGDFDAFAVLGGYGRQLRRAWTLAVSPMIFPSRSYGDPNHGWQENAVWLRDRPGLHVRTRAAWGTRETVEAVNRAADEMMVLYPTAPEMVITELSHAHGGRIKPHKSHQSGRDVDVLLYFKQTEDGKRGPMDLEQTWAEVNAFIRTGAIEVGILDYRQQGRLYRYAHEELGVPKETLRHIFTYPRGKRARDALFVHAPGHRTHLHIRYASTMALENVTRLEATKGYEQFQYVTEAGDTLASLARRFETSVEWLQAANPRLGAEASDALPKWRLIWIRAPHEAASTPCFEAERLGWMVSDATDESVEVFAQ